LQQREDDNEEVIGNRLSVYQSQTEPLIEFYNKRNRLKTVAAEGSIDEVYSRLLEALS
jgi:adenylate kinase